MKTQPSCAIKDIQALCDDASMIQLDCNWAVCNQERGQNKSETLRFLKDFRYFKVVLPLFLLLLLLGALFVCAFISVCFFLNTLEPGISLKGTIESAGAMVQASRVLSIAFFLWGISTVCSTQATKNVDFSGITQLIPHHQPPGDEPALLGMW